MTVVVSWIVVRADGFKAKRPSLRHLRDALTGFRHVEMRCIAKQNDEAFARIHLEFIGIEMIAQAEVETQDMIEQTRSSRCLCGIILTRWVL